MMVCSDTSVTLNPKHMLVSGSHTRYVRGVRHRYKSGAIFRPTDAEIKSFGDRLKPVDELSGDIKTYDKIKRMDGYFVGMLNKTYNFANMAMGLSGKAMRIHSIKRDELPSTFLTDNKQREGLSLAWPARLVYERAINSHPGASKSKKAILGYIVRDLRSKNQLLHNEIHFVSSVDLFSELKITKDELVKIEVFNPENKCSFDASIGTVVFGDYSKYLSRWADSIVALGYYPREVIIVADKKACEVFNKEISPLFKQAGIPFRLIHEKKHHSLGRSRNLCVQEMESEWGLMLDVDDEILPHAMHVFADIAPHADVICSTVKFTGIAANRGTRNFKNTSQKRILSLPRMQPCTHLSPFRKHFWLQQPYIELKDHLWDDSAVWIGYAHNGAKRWLPTPKIVVNYNMEPSGHYQLLGASGRRQATEQLTPYILDKGCYKNTQLSTPEDTEKIEWSPKKKKKENHPAIEYLGGGFYKTPEGEKIRGKDKALISGVTVASGPQYLDVPPKKLDMREKELKKIKEVFSGLGKPWFVTNGTALGGFREKDFIQHDWDMDFSVRSEEWSNSDREALKRGLVNAGMRFVRNYSADHYRFCGSSGNFCIYFYRIEGAFRVANTSSFSSPEAKYFVPKHLFEGCDYVTIRGEEYPAFSPIKEYILWQYGENWETPVRSKGYLNFAEARSCKSLEAKQALKTFKGGAADALSG